MEYNDFDCEVDILVSCFSILGCLRMVKIWWSFKWLGELFLGFILLWNGMIFLSVWGKIFLVMILGCFRIKLDILLINSSLVLGGEMFDCMIRFRILIIFLSWYGVVMESDILFVCFWVKDKFGFFFFDRFKSLEKIEYKRE